MSKSGNEVANKYEVGFCEWRKLNCYHLGNKTIREELRVEPAKVYLVHYIQESLICPVCKDEGDTTIVKAAVPTALMVHIPASAGTVALEYFSPLVELMHMELINRDVIHADEVPCQVLHEEGKDATSKSYMWIYLSGTDGKAPITIYDYRPGRSGDHPIENPITALKDDENLIPAEKGVLYYNLLFYYERQYKKMQPDERKQKRLETEVPIWNEFFEWIETLNPTGGSKLEKAVNYAVNHKESLMNYLLDGRCELSNNAAERKAKSYVMARKNFLFHNTVKVANATALVFSLVETAKANNLNVFQYLYTVLLYMPDYINNQDGIKQLLPWSEFIQQNCTGITDIEKIKPETRGNLPV